MATVEQAFVDLFGTNPVVHGLVGGLVIAGLNLLGASIVFVWRDPSRRAMDGALGAAAGVMLAASFTSLIVPGIEYEPHGGLLPVVVGIVLGVAVLDRADVWVPHVHVLVTGRIRDDAAKPEGVPDGGRRSDATPTPSELRSDEPSLAPLAKTSSHERSEPDGGEPPEAGSPSAAAVDGSASDPGSAPDHDPGGKRPEDVDLDSTRVSAVLLFVVAITLHNMPEGLAVGVGFGSGDLEEAIPLMLAIGLQNVPEGLAVSVAAVNAGFQRRFYALLTGLRSGLVEIPLAVFGAWAVTLASPILPYAMGFAAGGMLYVILDEIVPETHANGNERIATLGTMAGLLVMLSLDVALAA